MRAHVDVAVIGAGPYGLSLSAHLSARQIGHRIVGFPMRGWTHHMPRGMLLKSEPFASSLSDPAQGFGLEAYCKESELPYAEIGSPVPMERFIDYGLTFQKRFVPHLEEQRVVSLDRESGSYVLRLDDGDVFSARSVVMAVGLEYFAHMPVPFSDQKGEAVSHSSWHTDPSSFRGKEVVVVGGGASAIDWACLIAEAGGHVHLTTRRPQLEVHAGGGALPRPLTERLRRPMTGIGPSWRSVAFTEAPHLFRYLPSRMRLRIVRNYLGPAGGWFMKDRLKRSVQTLCNARPLAVTNTGTRVRVALAVANDRQELECDHIIAATGYRVDVRKIDFISQQILNRIRTLESTPVLSGAFESSLPGLFFVGPSSASSFGPLTRFVFGVEFTSNRLARYLHRDARLRAPAPKRYALVGEAAT